MPGSYNYKGYDLDLDQVKDTLRNNVGAYIRSKGWDDQRQQEFRDAYNEYIAALEDGRLSTGDFDQLVDSAYILNNGNSSYRNFRKDPTNKNYYKNQEQYDALGNRRQKKYTGFTPNREVAAYFDRVLRGVKDYDEKNTAQFDPSKHGFWQHFYQTYGLSPEDFKNVDKYDKEKGGYTTNEMRAKQLANYIRNNYAKEYANHRYKYDDIKDHYHNINEYIAEANQLANMLEEIDEGEKNFADLSDNRFASHLIGDSAQIKQFKDYLGLGLNEADKQAAEEAAAAAAAAAQPEPAPAEEQKPEEEEQELTLKDLQDVKTNRIDKYYTYNGKLDPFNWNDGVLNSNDLFNTLEDNSNSNTIKDIFNELIYANENGNTGELYEKIGGETGNNEDYSKILQFIFTLEDMKKRKSNLFNLEEFIDKKNRQLIRTGKDNWHYLPGSYNKNNMSVFAWQPMEGGGYRYGFQDLPSIYDWKSYNNDKYREQDEEFYEKLKELYNKQKATPSNQKNGGAIKYQGGGSIADVLDERSKITKSQSLRRAPGKAASDYSDNEFTAADKARMGGLAADLASVFMVGPASAAASLASTGANLYADIKDGVGVWNATGRFLAGLGLSALSVIPVLGNTAKLGKVVHTVGTIAPKLMKWINTAAIAGTILNGDEIVASLSKIGKKGVENEMSMQDWRNIFNAVTMVIGGSRVGSRAYVNRKMKHSGAENSEIALVRVKDANGESKAITMDVGDQKTANLVKKGKMTLTDENNLTRLKNKAANSKTPLTAEEQAQLTSLKDKQNMVKQAADYYKQNGKFNNDAQKYIIDNTLDKTNSYKGLQVDAVVGQNKGKWHFMRKNDEGRRKLFSREPSVDKDMEAIVYGPDIAKMRETANSILTNKNPLIRAMGRLAGLRQMGDGSYNFERAFRLGRPESGYYNDIAMAARKPSEPGSRLFERVGARGAFSDNAVEELIRNQNWGSGYYLPTTTNRLSPTLAEASIKFHRIGGTIGHSRSLEAIIEGANMKLQAGGMLKKKVNL